MGSDGEDSMMPVRSQFHTFVRSELEEMYANHYEAPRNQHPCGPSHAVYPQQIQNPLSGSILSRPSRYPGHIQPNH